MASNGWNTFCTEMSNDFWMAVSSKETCYAFKALFLMTLISFRCCKKSSGVGNDTPRKWHSQRFFCLSWTIMNILGQKITVRFTFLPYKTLIFRRAWHNLKQLPRLWTRLHFRALLRAFKLLFVCQTTHSGYDTFFGMLHRRLDGQTCGQTGFSRVVLF